MEFATVVLERTEQWGVADLQGKFSINNVPPGKNTLSISCLGYATWTKEIQITKDITNFKISLKADNLALEGAVVTAQEDGNSATTSRTIDKTALEHVQLMNLADISSLLPGGATTNNNLTAEKQFNIRGGSSENGNSSFGTAVEVDGVRLSNNASFTEASSLNSFKGVSVNNIASTNVESVEVITGVPSVEYGDMGSGVVKINTKKGKTPWMLTMSTSPNTKQTSVSKGFGLGVGRSGAAKGVINASMEYTESFSKAMSPYEAYNRRQASLSYMNLFNTGMFASSPLRISASVTGNLGGMNSSADPDAVQGTWSKGRDNALRGSFNANWLLSKSWITNLEFNASASYSDKSSSERTYNSSASNKTVLHGREKGYYMEESYIAGAEIPAVKLIPPGYWFNVMCIDDRPLSTKLSLKANLAKHIGKINNKVKAGADWSSDRNYGIGQYSEDMAMAPTFREYRYCDVPAINNIGLYVEDNLLIPAGNGKINIVAGIRSDNTAIKGSAYGVSSSLSPRFNAKYTVFTSKGRKNKTVRELSFRGSWGLAVKLPSLGVLYPVPTYRDVTVFTSSSNSANQSFSAFFIQPRSVDYNPNLRKQRNRLCELGVETDISGNRISLAAFWNRTLNAYRTGCDYEKTSYYYTSDSALGTVAIPADDRAFSVDHNSGVITVSDKNGILPSQTLAGTVWREFVPRYYADNESSPTDRYGLEWVIDFAKINPINTTIRFDGTFYAYRSLNTDVRANCPYTQKSVQDKLPYQYVGWYYGGHGVSNGSETKSLRSNLTITTHIPRIRLILSMKVEANLLKYSRSLSETADGKEIAQVISQLNDELSTTGESIYAGNNYVVRYPEYYTSYDDPTPRNFLEDLKAAKAEGNDKLLKDLLWLTDKTAYLYTFGKDYVSPFYSANFSVTKEIGDRASVSFYANNFFNSNARIWSSKTASYMSSSLYIPKFYYGLTLRIKF